MLTSSGNTPNGSMPAPLEDRLGNLSLAELEEYSGERQAHLKMQRQQALTKEERLNNLMSQFHRHEQKLDNLRHIRASLQSQESRLRELRNMKAQLDRQTASKSQLGEELEKTKTLFSAREKELAEAVAKVDILTAQLDRSRTSSSSLQTSATDRGDNSNAAAEKAQSTVTTEIERLKQEQRFRSHVLQQQKRKIDDKESSLLHKTLQRNQLDQRINDIAERLQKRRSPNDVPLATNTRPPLAAVGQLREGVKVATVEPYSQKLDRDLENYPDQNVLYSKIQRQPPEPIPSYSIKPRLKSTDNDRSQSDTESSSSKSRSYQLHQKKTSTQQQQREENEVLRESSGSSNNLPNLVTDTLANGRSTCTPDTSSSSDAPPSASSSTMPISDPTPPKNNVVKHHHGPIHTVKKENVPTLPVKSVRRVKFDPQALLLDASLEGELELVIKTCQQVIDPSASNDEGITALHNAICAGHFPIVKFLVEYGCDVNCQDSDGWSPLHCAASCNSLSMCRFLVEHGACIFAVTHSDQENAAQKCEEDEADYEGCSQYLLDCMKNLGKINGGIVYAVYDYDVQNPDEMSLKCGDKLKVLKTADDHETEWFWAEKTVEGGPKQKPGYIPRNFLALYPRVIRSPSGK